jgi:hypothetical protein
MPSRTAQAGLQTTGGAATSTYANSVAGGMIGYASTTTAQGVGAAETTLTGLSIAVTVNANRKIRIEGYVPIGGYGTGTAGERSYVRIKENVTEFTGAAVSEQVQNGSFIAGVARPCAISGIGNMPGPLVAGNHTFYLSLEGLSTSNTSVAATTAPATTRPAWIAVFDDGPAF